MNKYYFDFFKEKLKKDVIHELLEKGIAKELLIKEVNLYFEGEIQFEDVQQMSGTHQMRPRSIYQDKKNRCKARIWNEGEGGQCSCTGLEEYNGFCKTHFKKGENQWFLGTIHQPRPERPIKPDGTLLVWNLTSST